MVLPLLRMIFNLKEFLKQVDINDRRFDQWVFFFVVLFGDFLDSPNDCTSCLRENSSTNSIQLRFDQFDFFQSLSYVINSLWCCFQFSVILQIISFYAITIENPILNVIIEANWIIVILNEGCMKKFDHRDRRKEKWLLTWRQTMNRSKIQQIQTNFLVYPGVFVRNRGIICEWCFDAIPVAIGIIMIGNIQLTFVDIFIGIFGFFFIQYRHWKGEGAESQKWKRFVYMSSLWRCS